MHHSALQLRSLAATASSSFNAHALRLQHIVASPRQQSAPQLTMRRHHLPHHPSSAIDAKRGDGIFCGSLKARGALKPFHLSRRTVGRPISSHQAAMQPMQRPTTDRDDVPLRARFLPQSGRIPHGQAACALLLDESYDLIAQLTDTAGPISAVRHPPRCPPPPLLLTLCQLAAGPLRRRSSLLGNLLLGCVLLLAAFPARCTSAAEHLPPGAAAASRLTTTFTSPPGARARVRRPPVHPAPPGGAEPHRQPGRGRRAHQEARESAANCRQTSAAAAEEIAALVRAPLHHLLWQCRG